MSHDLQDLPATIAPNLVELGLDRRAPRLVRRLRRPVLLTDTAVPVATYLTISIPKGATTAKVCVSHNADGSVTFNTDFTASTYSDGVVFLFDDASDALVQVSWKWQAGSDITGLSSETLQFVGAGDHCQTLSVAQNTKGGWTGDFTVNLTSGDIDPQIIVTPIGGTR